MASSWKPGLSQTTLPGIRGPRWDFLPFTLATSHHVPCPPLLPFFLPCLIMAQLTMAIFPQGQSYCCSDPQQYFPFYSLPHHHIIFLSSGPKGRQEMTLRGSYHVLNGIVYELYYTEPSPLCRSLLIFVPSLLSDLANYSYTFKCHSECCYKTHAQCVLNQQVQESIDA